MVVKNLNSLLALTVILQSDCAFHTTYRANYDAIITMALQFVDIVHTGYFTQDGINRSLLGQHFCKTKLKQMDKKPSLCIKLRVH